MEQFEAIEGYLNRVIEGLKDDAQDKDQKIPVSSLRAEVDAEGNGQLYAADYMKYLIYGRPPGKQPPPEIMFKWVAKQPEASSWTDSEIKSMAFLVGRKIGKEGTDIWQGKKEGIDLLGVMDREKPLFLEQLGQAGAAEIATTLRSVIQ